MAGVVGGVAGGIPGGTVGGVVGGIVSAPPPPPPPPVQQVRPGGDIREPVKVKDALPIYPVLAQQAKVGGVVYLQAIIARDGSVKDVQVLRGNALLNEAAVAAVRQWRYSPTTLGGVPVEVILSVTVNFQIK
jgi:protein TonB